MKSFAKAVPLVLAAAVSLAIAQAQSVVTDPVGFITVSAKAGVTGTPATTFIGLSMSRPAVYQSVVPSTGGASTVNGATVITFPANSFTAGQFGPGAGSLPNFYLEILNGSGAGILSEITATATNSITLADNVSSAITNGTTTFRIRPHWTFGAAFGANNEAGLLGAATPGDADIVNVINPLTGAATGYFYNTASGHARWEKTTDTNTSANDVPVSPESGLQLVRKGTTDLAFKLAGAVKTGPTAFYVEGNLPTDTYNLIGNPYPLESVMLKDSGLYTGNETSGLVGGSTPANADIVRIYDFARNQYNDYYYNTSESKWKTGFTDASLTVLPSGSGLSVIRRANRSPFTWYAQQPQMALGDTPIPLQLVSAEIRRTHGGFGDADMNLPLTSTPGLDNRTNGNPRIVFTFNRAITSGNVTVSGGASVGQISANGKEIIAPLNSVSDSSTAIFTISNVTDGSQTIDGSQSVSAKFLAGDINQTKSVTIGDQNAVKNNFSQALTLGNFEADLNCTGSITIGDQNAVKNNFSRTVQ